MELLVIAILLTVAEAQLQCSTDCVSSVTAEGDQINMKCQLTHSSSSTPTLTWHSEQDGPELEGIESQTEVDSSTVSRDFPKKAEAPGVAPLVCLATIPDDKVETCTTEECNILYSVRNVVTSPQLHASPGEEITCEAGGNPPPKFEWQQKKDSEDGEWKTLANETSDKIEAFLSDGTYIQLRCVAKNEVKGEKYEVESAEVTVSKYGAYIRTAIIVGVVIGVALLGGTAGIAYKVRSD